MNAAKDNVSKLAGYGSFSADYFECFHHFSGLTCAPQADPLALAVLVIEARATALAWVVGGIAKTLGVRNA